jgi:hypothetical protein
MFATYQSCARGMLDDGFVSKFNVGLVTSMSGMFAGATAFNQVISGWNVGLVMSMHYMFYRASTFNRNLCPWKNKILFIPNTDI